MIDKINHYALTHPASVYDEEALTALELVGRTTKKVNDCIDAVNDIPEKIAEDVQQHINDGDFDRQIGVYAGKIDARIDNLASAVTPGTTSADAELIDIRLTNDGQSMSNAGEAVRYQVANALPLKSGVIAKSHTANLLNEDAITDGWYYRAEDGAYIANPLTYHYPLFEVSPSTVYTLVKVQIVTCFDANKTPIYSEPHAQEYPLTFTTPANARYMTVSKTHDGPANSAVFLGEVEGVYSRGENLLTVEQVDGLPAFMTTVQKDYIKRTQGKNYFNPDSESITESSYYNYQSAQVVAHPDYNIAYIWVKPNTVYTVSPAENYHVVYLDIYGNFLSGTGGWENCTFTTPANCGLIALSYPKAISDTLQLEEGSSATSYEGYGYGIASADIIPGSIDYAHLNPKLRKAMDGKNVVTIGPDGCDYTRITAAVINNPENTRFIISPGTYDLQAEYEYCYGATYFDEYTGYFNTTDVNTRGLYLKPGCELIGRGNVEIVFNYSGDNEDVKHYFSILNPSYDNVIENLTLRMADGAGRYHIHDDFAVAGIPGKNIIRNVRMYGSPYLGTAIGAGMGTQNTYIIDGCWMEGAEIGISYHNNIGSGKNYLYITNCYMDGYIRLLHYGTSTEKSLVQISNCCVNHGYGIKLDFTDESTYPNENIECQYWGVTNFLDGSNGGD